jgi:hypothetical protein
MCSLEPDTLFCLVHRVFQYRRGVVYSSIGRGIIGTSDGYYPFPKLLCCENCAVIHSIIEVLTRNEKKYDMDPLTGTLGEKGAVNHFT